MRSRHLIAATLVACAATVSAAPAPFTEGEITLQTKEGQRTTVTRYLRKGDQLRIDRPGTFAPAKPINIIDLKTGGIRILRPHNGTWMELPAERMTPHAASAVPEPPMLPGIGAHPTPPGNPGKLPPPDDAVQPRLPPGIGPQPDRNTPAPGPSPLVPVVPQMPEIPTPTLPDGSPLPPGIGPRSGQTPGIVPGKPSSISGNGMAPGGGGMPFIPPMVPGNVGGHPPALKLLPEKETRTIHGYPCRQYTLTIPRTGVLTLWLSDAEDLPPFHLLVADAPSRRGPTDWRLQWPALARQKHLFPMLVVLRAKPYRVESEEKHTAGGTLPATVQGRELIRWEISTITQKTIEDQDDDLFSVPARFHETKLSPF